MKSARADNCPPALILCLMLARKRVGARAKNSPAPRSDIIISYKNKKILIDII